MELPHYEVKHYDEYMNNIVMIPDKIQGWNGFYKIVESPSEHYFYVQKIKCETKRVYKNDLEETSSKTKTYEAILSSEYENEEKKKIKKSSVQKKYPIIICNIVRYEI